MSNILTKKFILYKIVLHYLRKFSLPLADTKSLKFFSNCVVISFITLDKYFGLRKKTISLFLVTVNNLTIRKAIGHFQVNIEKVVKYIDHVCYYYSQYINLLLLEIRSNNNAI